MIVGLNAIIIDIEQAKNLQAAIRSRGWNRKIIAEFQQSGALSTITELDSAIREIERREVYREED